MNAPSAALHVREFGQPGSPAIVFLHATGASGGMWEQHLQRLGGYHCLAPDLPGHGRSNHLPWRSRIDTAKQVARLIQRRIPPGVPTWSASRWAARWPTPCSPDIGTCLIGW